MSHLKDLTGHKYERLTVLYRDHAPQTGRKRTKWICQCACGKQISVVSSDLLNGHTKSCGCYHKDRARASLIAIRSQHKYFHCKQYKSYRIWGAMHARCYKPNTTFYEYYGGRGIKVCERWHDYYNFIADMGEPALHETLDRIDCNKDYSPENCRWATMQVQNSNRRSTYIIKHGDDTMCMKEFCSKFNLNYHKALGLYKKGMSIDMILQIAKYKK